jgi:hypothetical protein
MNALETMKRRFEVLMWDHGIKKQMIWNELNAGLDVLAADMDAAGFTVDRSKERLDAVREYMEDVYSCFSHRDFLEETAGNIDDLDVKLRNVEYALEDAIEAAKEEVA